MTIQPNDLLSILPVIVVVVWGILVLVVDLFIPRERKGITAFLTAAGLVAALGSGLAFTNRAASQSFHDMVVRDQFSSFTGGMILISGLAVVGMAHEYLQRMKIEQSEFYALLMFSTAGMLLLVQASNLIVLFLSVELLSIPLYVMTGMARTRPQSEEAGIKYFILSTMSSGILFYGIALVYGGTGHTGLAGIVQMAAQPIHPLLFMIGASMILIGLAFKLAVVPFHMWAPDVYEGAPTPVTGWMAVAVKVAGLAALLRVLLTAFPLLADKLVPILIALAAITMLAGNMLALVQSNIKRLLAYSSITHVGYMLLAVISYANEKTMSDALTAVLFYLVSYAFTSYAAWAVASAVETEGGRGLEINDYAGLGLKYPLMGIAMSVAMLSFTGIPPTLGFWGKLHVFRVAIDSGYVGLAVFGLLASLLSAYYYLRVIVVMYMKPGEPQAVRGGWTAVVAGIASLAVVLVALFPNSLIEWAAQALMKLL